MKEIKRFYRKTKAKIEKKLKRYPAYHKLIRVRDAIAEYIRRGLLAFFNAISPVWTFLCVKTLNPDQTAEVSNNSSLGYDFLKLAIF